MAELRQTKGNFKVKGIVKRMDKDGAYKEEEWDKGERAGTLYRKLQFGIQTSENNEIPVSMFDYEPQFVYLWNKDKKEKDPSYKGDKVPLGTWEDTKDELREQGFTCLSTKVGVTYDEKGKLEAHGVPSWEASEMIYDHVRNGDSVVIEGEVRITEYKDRDGNLKKRTNYGVKKIFKLANAIDFEAEDFEEITYFEQEMVFVDTDIDKSEGKAYVTGRMIDYKKNFVDAQFVINFKNEEGKNDADMVKLAQAFKERLKFGDIVTVYGDAQNRVVLREVEDDESKEDDLFKDFGGRKKPKHTEKFVAKDYITEFSILGVEHVDEGAYTEDDFYKDNLDVDEESNSNKDSFGGKESPFKKKVEDDPFKDDTEIDDDDLPF